MEEKDVAAAVEINVTEFGSDRAFAEKKFATAFAGSAASFAAEEDGKVVGYVIALPKPLSWTPGTAYIQLLGVRRDQRGKGLGDSLMEGCLEELREKGFKNVEIVVPVERQAALGLYRKYGFRTADYKLKKKL